MLYLRRRNQLLQEKARACDDPTVRRSYLTLRSQILANRYGSVDKRYLYNIANFNKLIVDDETLQRECVTLKGRT